MGILNFVFFELIIVSIITYRKLVKYPRSSRVKQTDRLFLYFPLSLPLVFCLCTVLLPLLSCMYFCFSRSTRIFSFLSQSVTMSTSADRKKYFPQKETDEVLFAFTFDFKGVVAIDKSTVEHKPDPTKNVHRYSLCRSYAQGTCKHPKFCCFVHAPNPDPASISPVHINYVYSDESQCLFERWTDKPAFKVVVNLGVHVKPLSLSSHLFLRTKAELAEGSTVSLNDTPFNSLQLCPCYHEEGCCLDASNCRFVHLVHLNAKATKRYKWAPSLKKLISSLGPEYRNVNSVSHERSSKESESSRSESSSAVKRTSSWSPGTKGIKKQNW